MTLATLIVLVCAIAIAVILLARVIGEERTNVWVQIFQAVATTAAITLAGYWYFIERRGEPHADVSQTAEVIPLGKGRIAVEVHVHVQNLGRQLLRIDRFVSRLQLADVDHYGMNDLIGKNGLDYWHSTSVAGKDARAHFNHAELRWPQLNYYDDKVEHEIEPGESDLLVATFLLNCPPQDFVRVASDVAKPIDEQTDENTESEANLLANAGEAHPIDDRRMMWKARSFVNVGKICRKEKRL